MQGQRPLRWPGDEGGNHDLVERCGEGENRAGQDAGQDERKDDPARRHDRRCAETEGREPEGAIETAEARSDADDHERNAEGGVKKDDPAVKAALEFIGKCQNLPDKETNPLPFAKKTTDDDKGGLTYTPLDPEHSQYKTTDGGLRSLGAMTYAGLKSFLYAGVSRDDPRVKGAIDWIRAHYSLEENPGMKKAGLYYYYHTFAKGMSAWGEDPFMDKAGKKHDWRAELFEALKKQQRPDGSWINQGDRAFGENDPNLSTAFAVMALSYCLPAKK